MTKSVLLRAPLLTRSGYGTHSRQIAKWLFQMQDAGKDIQVTSEVLQWGNTPWILDPQADDGLIGRIMQSTLPAQNHDVSIQVQLPNEWNPFAAEFNIGVTAGVETTKCSAAWIEAINKMNLVVVPSEFTKKCFLDSGTVTTPIEVVPEAFLEEILDETIEPLDLGNEITTNFNFLLLGQVTGNNAENDRKNLFYTIKWLAETFEKNPNVGVIVKTNLSRNTVADRIRTQQLLAQVLVQSKKSEFPKFYLMHGEMTNKEVVGLMKHESVKALVSLSHGEGFNLPALEAAALGLPVIATDWSAHTEFLGKGKFVKVEKKLVPVPQSRVDGQIFVEGAQWANPLEEDARRKLKKFCESSSVPREWALDLKTKIREQYSFSAIADKYTAVLGDKL